MIRAVLGGSFDPVHDGHVALASHVLDRKLAHRLIVVPARISPHKQATCADDVQRLAMVRLAFPADTRIEVRQDELRRPGPSFTVDTLRLLVAEHPQDRWRLVVGADHLAGFATWSEPSAILDLAELLVVPRRGHPAVAPPGVPAERMVVAEGFDTPVSSTGIRAMLAAGDDPVPGLPAQVSAYIRSHGLYGR